MKLKNLKLVILKKNQSFFDKIKDEFSEQTLVESGLFYFDEKKKFMLKDLEDA